MKARKTVLFFTKSFEIALPVKTFLTSKVAAAIALITFMVFTHVAVAGPHPNMYLNQAEIDTIRDKVSANVQPWAGAYSKVISAANSALNKSPLSVTFQGKTTSQYFTEKPYCGWPDGCRDGQINPNADRGDYTAAIQLSDAVRDLGLAYAFTGEARYADKAIEMIRVWSLNPGTRMKPTTSAGNRIELFITLPGYFYGADLIWSYGGWDAGEKAAFAGWVKAIGDHAKTYGAGLNNFANWRVVLIASAGALLDDNTLLNFAVTEWKRLIPLQISGNGKMGQEIGRTQGLHYSLYAINAMIQGAEILRHRNVNLYDYRNSGKSLELALDYITPYAINPNSWPYQQIRPITERNSMALYELAYSHYEKPLYLDAINRWTRPMDEIRVMGINTLTHANRFDLTMTPTAPSIVTQPDAVTVAEGENASFSVVSSGSGPLTYQWFRDGVRISSAADASYTVTAVSSSDSGSVYSCDVSNSLGSVSSSGAVLMVLSDSAAPTLVSATATNDTRVDIVFSEPVSASSAKTTGNYQIDLGIGVSAASLSNDGRTVSLTVSRLTADTAYTVLVSNVQDVAQSPNTIVAQSSQRFTYRTADGFEDGTADGWNSLVTSNWRVVMDEGDMAYYLNTSDYSSPGGGRLGEYSLLPAEQGDFTFAAQARLGNDVTSNAFADYAVVFGYQDPNNYYYALFNNDQNATQLFKIINGSRTVLATASSDWLSDNAYHSIEVTRVGSAISVHFDDNIILSADDSSLGAGKVGVGSFNDSAYFDDVSVTAGNSTTSHNTAPVSDNTAPVITLNGNNPQTITVGASYTELGASADDNVDGNITASIIVNFSAVDSSTIGSYEVTYNVTDAADNAATQVTRTVNVIAATVVDSSADGFEDGNADGWGSFVDGRRWSVVMDDGDMAYYLNTTSFSNRSGGRLGEYSLLPGEYGDFTFTAQAKLGDDVTKNAFADYAVIFGYQDSDNYYFMLFNNEQSATQLFKVINGSRTVLAAADSDWLNDNAYHSIEINRTGGAISVRFDDNVILNANDTSLGAGKVGVGSYNDSAYFDDVSVVDPASGVDSGGSPTNDGPVPKALPDDFNGDEFNGASLDLAQWTFVDPVGGSTASVGNGQLAISVSGGLPHNIWNSGDNSVRVTHATANQDFFAEVKFDSTPDQKYQLQGVLVEQDANNFIRFDFYSDGDNLKIFAATFQAGQPTIKVNTVIPTGGPLYMRIKREGNQWTQEYSYDGSNWQTAVSFAHTLTVASTNLFAGNAGENVPAFTARVDYYRTDAQ